MIADGVITAIAPEGKLPRGTRKVDMGGRLIMPGFINAHHHLYAALALGMPARPSDTFYRMLENVWWKLDRALTLEDVRLSARWSLAQSVRNGVTTVIDHHASYGAICGSLAVIKAELELLGLSGAVCFEVSDRNGGDAAAAAIKENLAFADSASVKHLFGLHAGFTLSDQTLADVKQAVPPDCGFHIHCAEDPVDIKDNHGYLIERLDKYTILRPQTLLIHGVHLKESDLHQVAQRKALIVHCPDSNLHNGVGAFDLARAQRLGVRVAAGTDGMHSSMLRTYKTAYVLSRHLHHSPRAGMPEIIHMYEQTQHLCDGWFTQQRGMLAAGRRADIAVLEYRPHTPLTRDNLWAHVLYGAAECPIHTTIAAGKVLMDNGVLKTCDEGALEAQCVAAAAKLWKRAAA